MNPEFPSNFIHLVLLHLPLLQEKSLSEHPPLLGPFFPPLPPPTTEEQFPTFTFPFIGDFFSLKRSTTDSAKKGEKSLPLPLFEGHKVDSSDRVTYSMGGRKFRNFRSFPSPHFFAKCRYLDSPATFPPPTQVFCAPLLPPLGEGVGGVGLDALKRGAKFFKSPLLPSTSSSPPPHNRSSTFLPQYKRGEPRSRYAYTSSIGKRVFRLCPFLLFWLIC